MSKKRRVSVKRAVTEDRLIDDALNQAVKDAVEKHREADLPLAVWKDGQVAWIQPDEVATPPDGKRPKAKRRA